MKNFYFRLLTLILNISMLSVNAQYHNSLRKIAEANKLIGMSVVVVRNGVVADVFHYGKANIERNIDFTDSTMFRVASISKTLTATALMILYERKLFQLDDDISKYLGYKVLNPNFPDKAITFRMLLSHTSSLLDGEHYDKFLAASYKHNPTLPLKQLLIKGNEYYGKDIWNNKEPGTFFTYSNLNFGILGTLIEKISGQRFDIFIHENILKPLGISGSFNIGDITNLNNLATLYRNAEPTFDDFKGNTIKKRDLSQYKIGENALINAPYGGFRVSALDLCKYMIMHMDGGEYKGIRILHSTTVELMHSIQWKYNGTNGDSYHNLFQAWGMGFQGITNTINGDFICNGTKLIGHSGDAYGLHSDMYFDENEKFGFIFITNGYAGKKEFAKAGNSQFYKPEAEVFKLIEAYFHKQ